jgi:hypothetical protein
VTSLLASRKYEDLSTNKASSALLLQFQLEFTKNTQSPLTNVQVEFELPKRLDLGISEKEFMGQ